MAAASTDRCTFVSGHSTASNQMAVHERLVTYEVIGCSRPSADTHCSWTARHKQSFARHASPRPQ